ncbi:hypothetical protein [Actinopolymorpha rutila]|uniref:Polymorphic outer membrane protein repeat-containing protein n=1 Tax=Actinopolymorpha rutila TaxID=446787 RepID=A0A852Z9Z2_9ACTN|nr:hypothetical protein [Actinopolymorpha rutila]NYH88652.1 hypothetical protein [Actinopolymorpha rutila]
MPCQTAALIDAINMANASPDSNLLTLASGCAYTLTEPQPGTVTGLPRITSPIAFNGLTGGGNVTITRSIAPNTPEFRIVEITSSGSLADFGVTISNGAVSDRVPSDGHSGGGILVREGGSLALVRARVTGNTGFAGGIHNFGRATLDNTTVDGNIGVLGGGINNEAEGTINIFGGSILSGNQVQSHTETPTISAQGGGIFNAGEAMIGPATIENNQALRSSSTAPMAIGGGISNDGTENPDAHIFFQTGAVVKGNSSADRPGGINNSALIFNLGTAALIQGNTPTNCAGSPNPVPECVG